MPFPLSELPSELQDLIMEYVHELEERDKQREVVAQLDGLLEDVVQCLEHRIMTLQ